MVMSLENYNNKRQWERIPENTGKLDMNEIASKEIVNREAREILRSIGCGHEEITKTIAECNGDTSKIQKAIDRIMDNKLVNEENNWETVQSRRTKKANEKNNKKNQTPPKSYRRHNRVFPKPYGRNAEYTIRDREGGRNFSMNNRTSGHVMYGNHKESHHTATAVTSGQPSYKSSNLHAYNNSTVNGIAGIQKGKETRIIGSLEKETKTGEEGTKNETSEKELSGSKGKTPNHKVGMMKKEKETTSNSSSSSSNVETNKKDSSQEKRDSIDKKHRSTSNDDVKKITKMDNGNLKSTEGKDDNTPMLNTKNNATYSNTNHLNQKKEYRSNEDPSKKESKGKGTHAAASFSRTHVYPNGDNYYKGYNKFASRGINEGSMTRSGKPRFNGINNRVGIYNSNNIYFASYSKGVSKKIYGNKKLNKRKRFVNKNDSDNEYDIYTGMKLNYDMPSKEKELEKEKEKEKKIEEEKKTEPKIVLPKNKMPITSYASVVNNSAKIITESETKEKEKKKNKCQLIPVNNKIEERTETDKHGKESVDESTKETTQKETKKGTNKTTKTKKKKEGGAAAMDSEGKELRNVQEKETVPKNETTEIEKGTLSYSSMVKKGSELTSTRCKVVDKLLSSGSVNQVQEKEEGEVESKEIITEVQKEIKKVQGNDKRETEEESNEKGNVITPTEEHLGKECEEEESKKKEKKKKKKVESEKKEGNLEKEKKEKTKKKKTHSEDSKKSSTKGNKGMKIESDVMKEGSVVITNNVISEEPMKNTPTNTIPIFMPNAFSPLSLDGQLFFGNICISNNATIDEVGKGKQEPLMQDVIEPNRKNKISRETVKEHDRMIRMNLLGDNTNIGVSEGEQPPSSNKLKPNQRIDEDAINPEEIGTGVGVGYDTNRRMKNIHNNNNNNRSTTTGAGGPREHHMNRMNSINHAVEYKNRRGNKRGDDYEDNRMYHENKQKFLFSNKNLPMNAKMNTSSIHSHMESYLGGHHNMQSHKHSKNNKHNNTTCMNDIHGLSNASNKHVINSSPMYVNQATTASPHATTSTAVMNAKHKYEHHVKNKNYESHHEREEMQEEPEQEPEHDSVSMEVNVMSQKVLGGGHQQDVLVSTVEHENTINVNNNNNIGTNVNAINNINSMNNMRSLSNMNNINNMNAIGNKNANAEVNNMNLINMSMNNLNNNNMYSSYNAPPGLANQFNYSFTNLSYPYNNMHYNGYNAQAIVPQYGLINNHYNKNNNIPPNNNFNYNLNYESFEENSLYAHNNNMHMNNYINFVNVGMKKNQMNIEEDNMSNSGDVSISGSLNPLGGGTINNTDHNTTNVNKTIHGMNACVDNNANANGMNVSLNAMNNHINPNLNLSYIDMKNKQHMSSSKNGTDTQLQGPMNQQVTIQNMQPSQHIHSQRKGTHSPMNSNNANSGNINQSRNSTQQNNKAGTANGGASAMNQFTKNQVHPNHSHRNNSAASIESEDAKTEEANGNSNGSNVNNTTSTGLNANPNENNEDKMEELENTNNGTSANVMGGGNVNIATTHGINESQNQYVNKQLYHNDNYYNVNSTNFNVPPGFSVVQEKEPNNNFLNNTITRNNANSAASAYRNNWNEINEKNMNHYNVNYNYNRGNKNGYNYSNNLNYNNANTYNGNRENANNFYNYNNYNYALQTPPGLQNFYQNTQYQQQNNYNNRNFNYSAYNNNLSMWNREKQ